MPMRISPTDIGSDLFGRKTEWPEIASPAPQIPLGMSSQIPPAKPVAW
jgi:hypothetical protein